MGRIRHLDGDRYELVVYVGRDTLTGKKVERSKTVHCSGIRAAKTALREHENDCARLSKMASPDMTLGQLIERWMSMSKLAPKTRYTYDGYIKNRIVPALGKKKIAKLETAHLDTFNLALSDSGMSASAVHNIHSIIRSSLKEAVRSKWIAYNPAIDAWKPPPTDPEVDDPPAPEQVRTLIELAFATQPEFGTFLTLTGATGARRGEVCAFRWSRLDRERGTIMVKKSISQIPGSIVEKETKTHQVAGITLAARTLAVLETHHDAMLTRARDGGVDLAPDAYIFSDALDGSVFWQPDRVTSAFRRLRNKAGLPTVRLHDLRHFCGSELIDAMIPVTAVAKRLRHRLVSTTTDIYGHPMEESERRAAEVMDDLIFGRAESSDVV